MIITVHTDKCLSCGMCSSIAPELFSIDTGIVAIKKDPSTYTEVDEKLAREAAAACPNAAIEVIT
ncbi:MAG: ferredoxin [Candidatus Gottesmanbacteria bacterium]